jgi:hypothetical protein
MHPNLFTLFLHGTLVMGTTSLVSEILFSIFQTKIKRGGEVKGGLKGGKEKGRGDRGKREKKKKAKTPFHLQPENGSDEK